MNYNRYTTAKAFALDEYFQQWVLEPDPESNAFWARWLEQHPEAVGIIADARAIIADLQIQEHPDDSRKEEIWKAINEANAEFDEFQEKEVPKVLIPEASHASSRWPWLRVAASVVLLLSAGVALLLYPRPEDMREEVTAFGEIRTVVLPDSSTVVLNGNSKIAYSPAWADSQQREVWLNGEAYFSVVHTQTHQKFIVHTSDSFSIEVLGTTFDVLQRPGRTRVVLNSGKIKLNLGESNKQEQIIMKPGELLEFRDTHGSWIREETNPENFSSWTENKLTFDGIPLQDVVTVLQENYGLHVTVQDSTLLKQELWGSVPSEDAELLLTALSNSFGLNTQKVGNEVRISRSQQETSTHAD